MRDIDKPTETALGVLGRAREEGAFPGAQFAVTHGGRLVDSGGVGRFTYAPDSEAVSNATVYDIASVTKVVAGTAMAMLLWQAGKLDIDAPVAQIVPEFKQKASKLHSKSRHFEQNWRERVTFRMLLAHCSGLPDYAELWHRARDRQQAIEEVCRIPLVAEPGTRVAYSDPGFILLGEAMERIAGERIDRFVQPRVLAPLGMASTRYCPPASWRPHIPPTNAATDFRAKLIQGEVHDENCWIMNGVSAHAGVFSSAEDLSKFALCMLRGGEPVFRRETIEAFTQRQVQPAGTSRALGWDTPSSPSSSGRFFSTHSFGHLGYTGTSLWIDAEADISIILLTNRVWPDRRSQLIKQVRPVFHDLVREWLRE
jgi:CubicO group peptidase (beta-lactamase class C family)